MSNPLHVIRCYLRRPPCSGGMEKHIAALSREQRALGVRVTDVTNEGDVGEESVRVFEGRRLGGIRPASLRDFVFYLGACWRLRHLRRESGPRILHVHGDWSAFLFGRLLGLTIGADVVVATLHASTRRPALARLVLGDQSLIFSTGKADCDRLRGVTHLPSAPEDLFFAEPAAARACDVVLVGSLVPVKNYDLLLEVAERLPDVRFAVIGDGPDAARLEEASRSRGLSHIDWRGAASPAQVRDSLAAAKVLLNLSYEEGSPTAALEAMAVGTPVVLTPSNDYSSLVGDNEAGIALEDWRSDTIVTAIEALLENEERRAAMSIHAKRRAAGERWNVKAKIVTDAMVAALARDDRA